MIESQTEPRPKIRLNEVTLMRCILALLIVFVHAFTCYNHSWREPAGYVDVPVYMWLTRISFAFTLEAFVFISGYLFAFQRITLSRIGGGISLIVNKLKRLILPSAIFSTLYFVIFCEYKGVGDFLYSIINGCGHMWFLPMLFWCFLGGWLLEQIKLNDEWKLVILVCLHLFAVISLPFQLKAAAKYMVYFYGGFVVYKHSETIKNALTPMRLLMGWVIFAVLFAVLRPMIDILVYPEGASLLQKLAVIVARNASQLVYAGVGVMVFYGTAVYYTFRHQINTFTVKLASCCFGIYLFQQFVLQILYYKTGFPSIVGPYWLPWCGFVIASIVSYSLSILLLQTKVGKYLIG